MIEYYNELSVAEADHLLSGAGGYDEDEALWCGEGEGEGEYTALAALQTNMGDPYAVSSLVFDKHQELVWTANQEGYVTSYYGPQLQRYTSFRVHATEDVRQVSSVSDGVLALTSTSLRLQRVRGVPAFTHTSEEMQEMRCVLPVSESRVLLGGHNAHLLALDLASCQQTVLAREEGGCVALACGGGALVACGAASGGVVLRDVRCGARAVHTLQAHPACLSDLDFQGDLLLTAGFDQGEDGGAVAERSVCVWDVRRLGGGGGGEGGGWRVRLPLAPLLLHFVPAVSGRAVAVSARGHVALFQVNQQDAQDFSLFKVDVGSGECGALAVSATSQALAFGDSTGRLHLYSARDNTQPAFNNFPRPTVFASPPYQHPARFSGDFHPSQVPLPPLNPAHKQYFHVWPARYTESAYRSPLYRAFVSRGSTSPHALDLDVTAPRSHLSI